MFRRFLAMRCGRVPCLQAAPSLHAWMLSWPTMMHASGARPGPAARNAQLHHRGVSTLVTASTRRRRPPAARDAPLCDGAAPGRLNGLPAAVGVPVTRWWCVIACSRAHLRRPCNDGVDLQAVIVMAVHVTRWRRPSGMPRHARYASIGDACMLGQRLLLKVHDHG